MARDVERSLWKFTVGNAYLRFVVKNLSKISKLLIRKKKRAELSRVVNGILSVHKELNYYQGLHDVASVFLLVANSEEEAFAMTERVCLNQLRYALNTTLDSTKQILNLLFPIIQCTDVNLFNYLQRSTVEPFFALSWILTWFSHSLDSLSDISRLFDLFLTSHPLMSLYVSAQIVIHFKDILLNNIECDFCAVHGFLSNLPPSIPIDNIIKQTINLYNTIPPSKLQSLYFPLSKRYFFNKKKWFNSIFSAFMNNYPYEWLFDSIYINKSITKDQQTNKLTIKQNVQNQEKKIEPFRKEKIVFYGLLFVFIVTSIIVFKT